MDLSVVIPCYDAGEKIVRCIKSIEPLAKQISLEVIVVNDGSKDNSSMLVKRMGLSFVKVIEKENGGVSSARNIGIEVASGDYLVFADADDYYNPEELLKVFLKASTLNCSMLMFGYNYVTPNRIRRIDIPNCNSKDELKKRMVDPPFAKKYNSSYVTGRVYQYIFNRSELTCRFDESLSYAEDLVFILDCISNCKKIEFCDIYAYNYVYEKGSESNRYRRNYYFELRSMYETLVDKEYALWNLGYLYYMDRAFKNYVGRDSNIMRLIMLDPHLNDAISNSNFNNWTLSESFRNNAIEKNKFTLLYLYYFAWYFCNNIRLFALGVYTRLRLK